MIVHTTNPQGKNRESHDLFIGYPEIRGRRVLKSGGVRGKEREPGAVRFQEYGRRLRPVCVQAIPNHQKGLLAELPGQLAQEREDQRGLDVFVRMQAEEEPDVVATRGYDKGGYGRNLLVGPASLKHDRRRSARRPRSADERRHHEARLVNEDQGCLQACGVFFTRGHSSLTQRRISSSSRSTARRWGFLGLHPKACRRRPIWSTW